MPFSSLSAGQRITVLLELLGGPKYAAQLKAASAETTVLGKRTTALGTSMQLTGRRTAIANQALYTFRRLAFYGTIAVLGTAAAVGKLGYSYLSAMQQARVALKPVIKDTGTLEGYLKRLFIISKYSPFVITDLAVSFREMLAGFAGTGVGAPTVLRTIQSITDALSFVGKTTPQNLNRAALALQKMAFQGRLTGRVVTQLGSDGIPIYRILNKELGVSKDQLANIAKLNIAPGNVLTAINKFIETTPGFKGAALRQSLQTFHGLIQVTRDSLSQISGNLLTGAYGSSKSGAQGFLFNLAKPGGPLDRLASIGPGGSKGVLAISKMLTGGTGLGRGFLLLLRTLQAIGRVFVNVVIPGWVLGAHALIVFYPVLKLVNIALNFLARHATIAKIVIGALAAEFLISHVALLGFWGATKLFNVATFGAVIPVRKLIGALWLLRTQGLAKSITQLWKYAFATKAVTDANGAWTGTTLKNNTAVAKLVRGIDRIKNVVNLLIIRLGVLRDAMIATGIITAVGAGIATAGAGLLGFAAYKAFTTPNPTVVGPTNIRGTNTNVVSASGVKYIQSQAGGRLTRLPTPAMLKANNITDTPGDIVVHSVVQVDRKTIGEAVSRAQQDKRARR